ncbi:ribonuclease BN [Clostridium tepidiprofundi DSM 19306]|uniref:Ribonuclease BN n=1 Tax=Clostridium tepidiprofundi DSM 19306 TaxID=1121338 RepID=A0A151B513_9CLOT|nr:ComEC/Rec2 family competence protein [Clostridium tepidiprofundi]KYH34747.1 ribonuclease BN [Clostridium tepidiprofundi DSM 19306]
MSSHKKHSITLILIAILVIMSSTYKFLFNRTNNSINVLNNANLNDKLIVHYIDIGEGDCELIQMNNKFMLIDAGSGKYKNRVCNYLKSLGVKKIDYIIATHPHEDHIGGMYKIIDSFDIGTFIAPKVTTSTNTFKKMLVALKKKKLSIKTAKGGMIFQLDNNVKCEIVAPNSKKYEKLNDYSVVLKVTYKNSSFLFTGDAEKTSEKEILSKGYNIRSDVLKVGHHGSNTSSTQSFLKAVNPKIAVISCGKGNEYGHPHKNVLKRLNSIGCKIFRTDLDGTIILISDGKSIFKLKNHN